MLGRATLIAVLAATALAATAQASDAPFSVSTHPYAFGQAPVFMPDGRVAHAKDLGFGRQVYIASFDGSHERCITCGADAPDEPNGVPAVRPQGDWVLFHSWD